MPNKWKVNILFIDIKYIVSRISDSNKDWEKAGKKSIVISQNEFNIRAKMLAAVLRNRSKKIVAWIISKIIYKKPKKPLCY